MQNQIRETARTVVAYLRALYNFCSCPLPTSPPERSTVNLLRGLAPLAPQTCGPRAARKLAQIVAAKSSPACRRPRAISPTASQRLTSRKRRTGDGIAVSCSTVTPDCQELDWHDARADTRPRDPPRVHPALQCLPTRTQAPSIAARRPAAQPRSARLTGRDGQAGQARCASCAWCPAPRPRPRSVTSLSVCHVVVVGLVPRRLLFRSKDLISKVGGVDSKDSSDLGFYYLFSKF